MWFRALIVWFLTMRQMEYDTKNFVYPINKSSPCSEESFWIHHAVRSGIFSFFFVCVLFSWFVVGFSVYFLLCFHTFMLFFLLSTWHALLRVQVLASALCPSVPEEQPFRRLTIVGWSIECCWLPFIILLHVAVKRVQMHWEKCKTNSDFKINSPYKRRYRLSVTGQRGLLCGHLFVFVLRTSVLLKDRFID